MYHLLVKFDLHRYKMRSILFVVLLALLATAVVCHDHDHEDDEPGRYILTFLLFSSLNSNSTHTSHLTPTIAITTIIRHNIIAPICVSHTELYSLNVDSSK